MSHLGNVRLKNPKNIIFSYININLIHNKFENLCDIVGNNVDVLSISEAKIDSSLPNAQFLLSGFHETLRLDINYRSGGLFVYKKVSLPSKILTYLTKILILNIQTILFEINLRKEKWLFVSIYKSQSQSNQYVLDMYFDSQENKFILRDFNLEPSNSSIASFMNNQN